MATRTIYTKSEVLIGATSGCTSSVMGTSFGTLTPPFPISAVTSATFTRDTPREQVTVFGKKGQVDTVQNESTTSTIEVVFHPWSCSVGLEDAVGNISNTGAGTWNTTGGLASNNYWAGVLGGSGSYLQPLMLRYLMEDAAAEVPKGEKVEIQSIGMLTKAILTSITAEGSVGALPTITLGFDGTGALSTDTATPDAAEFHIANMEDVALLMAKNTGAYAQSATFNWEMPVEKINKLGNSVESAVTYGTPPGTASIAVEGTDDAGKCIGVKFGEWAFLIDEDSEVSNITNSLAVGDIGGTYNTTTEGVADGSVAYWLRDPLNTVASNI